MGIIIAKVFDKKAKEPATPDFILPNEEQRAMIKKTWEVPKKNLMDSSEVIFYRYLEMFPHNQDSFDAFRNIPLITLKGAPGFRTHALRIMSIFQGAIDTFDTEDIGENLRKNFAPMALSHAKRKTSKQSFIEMKGTVVEVLTEVCNLTEEEKEAWRALFDCAFHVIFNRYDDHYKSIQN